MKNWLNKEVGSPSCDLNERLAAVDSITIRAEIHNAESDQGQRISEVAAGVRRPGSRPSSNCASRRQLAFGGKRAKFDQPTWLDRIEEIEMDVNDSDQVASPLPSQSSVHRNIDDSDPVASPLPSQSSVHQNVDDSNQVPSLVPPKIPAFRKIATGEYLYLF